MYIYIYIYIYLISGNPAILKLTMIKQIQCLHTHIQACLLLIKFVSFHTVVYCLNQLQDGPPNVSYIEITNYVFINSLLGVDNISEGYNLSLQVS